MARLKNELKDFVLHTSREDAGMQSPFLYATLIEYDPETKLSRIEVLGSEIQGVPSLKGVLDPGWEFISEGNSDAGSVNVPIPGGSERYSRLQVTMEVVMDSNSDRPGIRVNNDTTSSMHKWGFFNLNSATPPTFASPTGAFGDSTTWHLGVGSQVRSHFITDIVHLNPDADTGGTTLESPKFFSRGARIGGSNTTQQHSFAQGRLNEQREIESLQLLAGSGGLDLVEWHITGFRRSYQGVQLLCVRSKPVPLTIIGLLSGSTIEE